LDRTVIERAIAAMPTTRSTKPGEPAPVSLAPIRAAVIAATGIPPGLLKRIQPHDLVLVGLGSVRVSARQKGGGVEARTLPLTPDGLAAFKAFHHAHAYGPFPTESLNRSFKRGCKRAGLDPKAVRLYDLRHSFLTDLYRVTRDLATVGRMGLHVPGSRLTARYAQGANEAVDRAAVDALGAAWQQARQRSLKSTLSPSLRTNSVHKKRAQSGKLRQVNELRKQA
jgi:integrase